MVSMAVQDPNYHHSVRRQLYLRQQPVDHLTRTKPVSLISRARLKYTYCIYILYSSTQLRHYILFSISLLHEMTMHIDPAMGYAWNYKPFPVIIPATCKYSHCSDHSPLPHWSVQCAVTCMYLYYAGTWLKVSRSLHSKFSTPTATSRFSNDLPGTENGKRLCLKEQVRQCF